MVRAEKREIEAYASPQGQVIASHLERCEKDMIEAMIAASPDTVVSYQVAVRELRELIALAKNAKNVLR